LVRAVAAYGDGDFSAVITDLEGLLRAQPELPSLRPDALFYLARAHDALQHFGKGVAWGTRWVEGRRSRPEAVSEAVPDNALKTP
jgi:hypothetical protein